MTKSDFIVTIESPCHDPHNEYRDVHFGKNAKYRPWLDILDKFLDPKAVRREVFDVQVIHILPSGEIDPLSPINCRSPQEFEQAISRPDHELSGTLIITEDISQKMINTLGMKCKIEPEFFACHLQGTENFLAGEWRSSAVRVPSLPPDYIREAPFYSVEFWRAAGVDVGMKDIIHRRSVPNRAQNGNFRNTHHDSLQNSQEPTQEAHSNTPRGVLILQYSMKDLFIHEKVSVYQKKGTKFGIIITDKLLSTKCPSRYIPDIVTLFDESYVAEAQTPAGELLPCRKELVSWLRHQDIEYRKALFSNDGEPLALRPCLNLARRAGENFLAHARVITSRISLDHTDKEFPDSIPFFMRVTRCLHMCLHLQRTGLEMTLQIVRLKGSKKFDRVMGNFEHLKNELDRELKSLQDDMRFLATAVTVREGKLVGLLAKFGFLFLPVSLLATVVALMQPSFLRWAVLGGLSIPFVIIAASVTFFWKPANMDSLKLYTPKYP